jgi:hypothetical protein
MAIHAKAKGDALHVVDHQVGGSAKRSPMLRVLPDEPPAPKLGPRLPPHLIAARRAARRARIEAQLEAKRREQEALAKLPLVADLAGIEFTTKVPRTRSECPDVSVKPCGAVFCKFNLLRQDEPPGRPNLADVPRAEGTGHTQRVKGDLGDGTHRNPPRLDATAWVTLRPRPSCALALADEAARRGEGLTNSELGVAIGGRHRTLAARIADRAIRSFKAAGGDVEGLRQLAEESQRDQAHRPTNDTPLLSRLVPEHEQENK